MSSKQCEGSATGRPRGRPRGFKKEAALDAAVRIFWFKGYEGSAISDLCSGMGVPKATLYAEFGSKEDLFLEAVSHYSERQMAPVMGAIDGEDGVQPLLDRFFQAVIELATRDPLIRGCLVSCVLANASGSNQRFRRELARRFEALETRLAGGLDRALAKEAAQRDSMPDGRVTANLIAAIARGMMLKARAGAKRDELEIMAFEAKSLIGQAQEEH